jgi:hypothetical protein
MFPKHKRVKTFVPYCPKCKELLSGNNSVVSPYICKCGRWQWRSLDDGYDIVKY